VIIPEMGYKTPLKTSPNVESVSRQKHERVL